MRQLFRKPLTWMVAGEVVVVMALIGVGWHLLVTAPTASDVPALLLPGSGSPSDAPDASIPPDALVPPQPSGIPLLPGLNVDPAFWRRRLGELNGAQAQFEALEWRIIHSAMDSMRRYIETVVLPSIERAESGGRKV
ncbi:MAG TPA: hypothetical protein VFL29_10685 [Candidatus Dormibacteraeota bacterium]|nr:hypothetical protein [Candidatus Dormibacteraeota bacterium]